MKTLAVGNMTVEDLRVTGTTIRGSEVSWLGVGDSVMSIAVSNLVELGIIV